MRNRTKRALILAAAMTAFSLAAVLVLSALRDNIVFFKTPAEILAQPPQENQSLRIGGFVRPGSVRRNGTKITFTITDFSHDIEIAYSGLLPDLFREGQGVVAEGVMLPGGMFQARSILAKHDENYRPPGLNYPPDGLEP